MNSTLDVHRLSVEFRSQTNSASLLHDINFTLSAGSITVVVGESGSGKTTLACAVTRLFTRPERYRWSGTSILQGTDLLRLSDGALRDVRRSAVRYIFQEPAETFAPLLRIGSSIRDALGAEWDTEKICSLLERVGLPEPGRILRSYPHELSGGMLQRVAIAIAVATEPAVLIADEPTSALDAPLKWQIVDLLQKLHDEGRGASLIVTHDPGLVDAIADRLIVLFKGQIVEQTGRNAEPLHPYTRQLLGKEAAKSFDASIPRPNGCVFAHRCPRTADRCSAERPELERAESETWVRCFYWK